MEKKKAKEISKYLKKYRKDYTETGIKKKNKFIGKIIEEDITSIPKINNPESYQGNIENLIGISNIPIGLAGPIDIQGQHANGSFFVPMSTTEGALASTYDLGIKLTNASGGIKTCVKKNIIHITPVFILSSHEEYLKLDEYINSSFSIIKKSAESVTNHGKLIKIEKTSIGLKLFLKFIYNTADAQGLNMINRATFAACNTIREALNVNFYLRSHNSGIKHFSKTNLYQGYGRELEATAIIPRKVLSKLGVTPKKCVEYAQICKTAGQYAGIPTVNVHAANAIAAIFVATGQDIADLCGSCSCHTNFDIVNKGEALFIQVQIPNLLVATVGGGTRLSTQQECLKIMECYGSGKANKLAEIIAATVLAGELVTMSAILTETYVNAHNKYTLRKQ